MIANIAHRGASAEAPENTIAALRRAVLQDADLVEVDLRRTRDGALVLMHDPTLVRTTNVRELFPSRRPWRVADFTFSELRRLDAGAWKAPAYAHERVPTLLEALALVLPTRTGLLLELKAPALQPGVVPDLVTTLRGAPGLGRLLAEDRLVVQSFDFAAMKELKTRLPEVPVGLLGLPAPANLPALASWADQVNPSHLSLTRTYVDQVHDSGMRCHTWTVDAGYAMRRALRTGVDGVITNRPAALGRLLERRRVTIAPVGGVSR